MNLSEKFKEYFRENGVLQTWFAEKLGVSHQMFYNMSNGRAKVPESLWPQIIEMTGGKISVSDLMREKYRKLENFQINASTNPEKCEVIIKIKKESK